MRTTNATARRLVTALILGALAGAVLVAVAPGAGAAKAAKRQQGIVIGAEQFPPVLNDMTSTGNGDWTAIVAGPALARGYKLLPDFSYEPWIFD